MAMLPPFFAVIDLAALAACLSAKSILSIKLFAARALGL
jgi:hypothetical protein